MKIAIFPGSFDPITLGHVEIIRRGATLFDEIIVCIGTNSQKNYYFSLEERLEMLRLCFEGHANIRVATYPRLTVEFAREQHAQFILRGLRSSSDMEYEKAIELINKHMSPGIEVVYLLSSSDTTMLSSTLVREVIKYKGKLEGLLPPEIIGFVNQIKY